MTDTPIISGGASNLPSNTITQYNAPSGVFQVWSATESGTRLVIPAAGRFSNLYINTDTDPTPGSYTFTFYKNGSPTTLTCALTAGNTTASDTTHSVSVVAGDEISIECVPASTPTTLVALRIGLLHISTAVGESFILGSTGSAITANTTNYSLAQGADATAPTSLQTSVAAVMPTNGTISEMRIRTNTAPGIGQSVAYTLVKNGTDTAQTVTISGTNTIGSDLAHPIFFSAGDTISLKVVTSLTAAPAVYASGLKWVPTIDGEAVFLYARQATATASQTMYAVLSGAVNVNATETNEQQVAPAPFALKKFFAALQRVPGVNSFAFTARVNASSTGCPTFTITGGTTITGSDTSTTKNIVAGDKLALQEVASAGISSGYVGVGAVSFIVPHYGMSSKMMSMGQT